MKKTFKFLGIGCGVLLALLVVGGGVFWFGWIRAPEPRAVCEHTKELMQREMEEELPEGAFAMDECVSDLERTKEFDGLLGYAEQANCAVDAQSLEEMEACESD